jgi:colicin import membrane protein
MEKADGFIHIIKSFGVHIFFAVLFVLSFNFTTPEKEKVKPQVQALDAVVIDQKSLDKQIEKIKQKKADTKAAEEKRVKDLEDRARNAKNNLKSLESQKSNSERAAEDAKKKAIIEQKKAIEEKANKEARKELLIKEKAINEKLQGELTQTHSKEKAARTEELNVVNILENIVEKRLIKGH